MPPALTVIIYAGNCVSALPRALHSVPGQDERLEAVLIDDGCSDAGAALCESLAQANPRITLRRQPHAGRAAAYNLGLELGTGAFVAFLDGSDYLEDGSYAALLTAACTAQAEICRGKMRWDAPSAVLSGSNDDIRRQGSALLWSAGVSAALYRRSFLLRHHLQFPLLPCIQAGEQTFLLKALLQCRRLALCDAAVYVCCQPPAQAPSCTAREFRMLLRAYGEQAAMLRSPRLPAEPADLACQYALCIHNMRTLAAYASPPMLAAAARDLAEQTERRAPVPWQESIRRQLAALGSCQAPLTPAAPSRPRTPSQARHARRGLQAIVHLGMHKTGSSAIQTFAWLNRSQLLAQGILYPRTACHDPASGLYDHNNLYCGLQPYTAELSAELEESGAHTLLLSGEDLLFVWEKGRGLPRIRDRAAVEELRHWLNALGADSFRIIIYLREPLALLSSLYSQALKNGLSPPHSCPVPELYHALLDARALLQPWLEVFGRKALKVRLFERGTDSGQCLLQDFLQALALDATQDWQFPPRINTGLNLLEMEVLRALNVRRPAVTWQPHTPRGRLFALLKQHLACPGDAALRYAPSLAAREWMLERCAGGQEWVRTAFFPERPRLFALPPASPENYALKRLSPSHAAALAALLQAAGSACAAAQSQKMTGREWLQQACPSPQGIGQLLACCCAPASSVPHSPLPASPELWSELSEILCAAEEQLS